jgi:hypothetical protein
LKVPQQPRIAVNEEEQQPRTLWARALSRIGIGSAELSPSAINFVAFVQLLRIAGVSPRTLHAIGALVDAPRALPSRHADHGLSAISPAARHHKLRLERDAFVLLWCWLGPLGRVDELAEACDELGLRPASGGSAAVLSTFSARRPTPPVGGATAAGAGPRATLELRKMRSEPRQFFSQSTRGRVASVSCLPLCTSEEAVRTLERDVAEQIQLKAAKPPVLASPRDRPSDYFCTANEGRAYLLRFSASRVLAFVVMAVEAGHEPTRAVIWPAPSDATGSRVYVCESAISGYYQEFPTLAEAASAALVEMGLRRAEYCARGTDLGSSAAF